MVLDSVITFVISPILQEALSRATSYALQKITKSGADVRKELKEASESLQVMEDVIQDAEKWRESDDLIRKWLQGLEDLAHELVDLLDKYDYVAKKKVRTFISPLNMLEKIQKIKDSPSTMLEKIQKIKDSLNIKKLDVECIGMRIKSLENSEDWDLPDFSKLWERHLEVSRVVDMLTGLGQNKLSGVTIVGMPGVGKTILARLIKNCVKQEGIYDLVPWVRVSHNFKRERILGEMLEYLPDSNAGPMTNTDALLDKLENLLRNKKFLLILDDVWNVDRPQWNNFISRLHKILTTTGNSIVVTTSDKKVVASVSGMNAVPMHELELQQLSDGECWSIMRMVLTNPVPQELQVIGLDIAKQCGGLPLVAAALREELRRCEEANKWLEIKNNTALNSPHRKEILSKLKKCSDRLSSPLKKCFSYCSIFPKGFEIRRDVLVQLWLAKGFLHQSKGSGPDEESGPAKEEDVGDKYLNDLVSYSLLQDVEKDEYGNIKSCKMHDEMRNLALFISKYETYIWPDLCSIMESTRHVRVTPGTDRPAIPKDVAQGLHSLFVDVGGFNMPSNLRRLRSLQLAASKRRELEDSVCKSECHVKYLDISESKIKEIPKGITKLYNLQTLRFVGCESLEKPPSGVKKLVNLRHIYFSKESPMPSRIGKLTLLQTLELFVVGKKKGQKIEELKCLNQLRGKLKICNLENVSPSEAREAKLEDKGELTKLQFVWSKNRADSNSARLVLEGLWPNSNLKSLTIENYKGSNFPSWMVKDVSGSGALFRLNSLMKLKLIDCDECGDISCLGLLPKLQVLNLRAMSRVQRIGSMFDHNRSNLASSSQGGGQSITSFPALRKLKLTKMTGLEEWTAVQHIEELHIQDCPGLKCCHNRSNMASSSQGGGESITPFQALRKLTLREMKTLEEWTEGQGTAVFPRLEELHIQNCMELQTWQIDESISHKLSLLSIQSCVNLEVIPVGLSNLTSLDISNCPKLMAYAQKGSSKWSTIHHIGSIRINGRVVQS